MKLRLAFSIFKPISIFSIALFVVGCATAPSKKVEGVAPPRSTYNEYEAKAQINDKVKNSSHTVGIDIYTYSNQAMRMDISASLGLSVAHLLLKGKNISYMVKPWSRYYYGQATDTSLTPLLKMKLDPNIFYYFLYDQPMAGREWNCKYDQSFIKSCDNETQGVHVEWVEREGEKRRVTLTSPRFDINFLIKDHKTMVELPPQTFVLDAPEGYKKIPLN